MCVKEIESKARELQELRRMKEELEAEISALEDNIKAEMTARQTEDLTAGAYRIKWTSCEISRFDTTRFKKEHADLASVYTRITTARLFSIN